MSGNQGKKQTEKVAVTVPLLVAIDDGYAQTKTVGIPAAGGPVSQWLIRSSVRTGRYGGTFNLSGAKGFGSYVTEEGEEFTVSDKVEAENTQFDSFHVSPMNRVLCHHALLTAGYGGRDVHLATGLPVADFFNEDGRNDAKIEAKRANLLKSVRNVADGGIDPATLVKVSVGCQAIAAFVDYLVDDDFNERDVPTDSVAVVDIGGRTTDVAVVLGGGELDASRSGTENIGVLDAYKGLTKGIRTRYGVNDKFTLTQLDQALREKSIVLWGERKDLTAEVDSVVQEQEAKIAREVERKLGSAANIQTVLFVGGGSALFQNIYRHFRNGRMAPDPEFANARGLRKYFTLYPG